MRIADKLQEPELKIIKALYEKWKAANTEHVTFQADSINLDEALSGLGISKDEASSHLASLQAFDFLKLDGNYVQLLPSGIKYARGQFDHII